jgi:ssDNA thymidine ADP-ribosyltransferase, DarT
VVPVRPFGVVADYAPFYFAPRSPMMNAISHGRVPHFGTDLTGLMYLVTTTQALVGAGLEVLITDRNARLDYAEIRPEADCDGLVDWELMKETWWFDTLEYPDRSERRMAECLAHQCVPFDIFQQIGVHGDPQAAAVRAVLARHGKTTPVYVRQNWYF